MNDFNKTVVIIFSTADWNAPYWTNKQHMAVDFARLGFKVIFIESPGLRRPSLNKKDFSRILIRLKALFQAPRIVNESVIVISAISLPFLRRVPGINWLNRFLSKVQIYFAIRKIKISNIIIWAYHPYVVTKIKNLVNKVVYHCVDDLSTVPGVDVKSFNAAERNFLNSVDIVFTTSEKLQEKISQLHKNVKYYPNVVDFEHFSQSRTMPIDPIEMLHIPHPRLGYIGVLTDLKVDFSLIFKIATMFPEWHWVLIGDEREGQRNKTIDSLRKLPNVHFLGYKKYTELPRLMAGFDVATFPSLINSYTDSMFPMKYFEYSAAGLRIVSTQLKFTRDQKNIYVANDENDFINGIKISLEQGRLSILESTHVVGDNTWGVRTKKMLHETLVSNSEKLY